MSLVGCCLKLLRRVNVANVPRTPTTTMDEETALKKNRINCKYWENPNRSLHFSQDSASSLLYTYINIKYYKLILCLLAFLSVFEDVLLFRRSQKHWPSWPAAGSYLVLVSFWPCLSQCQKRCRWQRNSEEGGDGAGMEGRTIVHNGTHRWP